jgi:diguanylate cyclase (GGDEF)-like protein/PAS domain S-box-containing protein
LEAEPLAADSLEREFVTAWRARDFSLVYQPQVDARTRRITGFEALLRWRHRSLGSIPPGDFIPLAERIGLIDEIGLWVLQQACAEAASWREPLSIAVNVSAMQLRHPGLPDVVAGVLRRTGLPAARLELEITETALLNGSASLQVLSTIRDSGVRIAIDDFDAGYSSLGYLMDFPFDKLKIDRSFIERIAQDAHRSAVARAIVRAIIGLCENIGIVCAAEGVQTAEQMDMLVAAGCAELQGHLLGEPESPAGIPALLRRGPATVRPSIRLDTTTIPFAQIAHTANDIIIVTTPNLEPPGPAILYVNPAYTRLTGYSAAEAIGRTPRMLQGPGTCRATLDAIAAGLRAGRPIHEKILNFAKSGAPYWLDLQIVPLRDADGCITHFAAIERDITMDKRRSDELEYFADRDTLTGIPNRRALMRVIEAALDAAGARADGAAAKGPCLALVDVDNFKQVNDRFGHLVGDAVLCGLADCLAENARRMDMLGRIGGEEFLVCLPEVGLADARALADRLRCAIAAAPMATPAGPITVTVSIGVACFQRGDSVSSLMERADGALYAAKNAGRNRVRAQGTRTKVAS